MKKNDNKNAYLVLLCFVSVFGIVAFTVTLKVQADRRIAASLESISNYLQVRTAIEATNDR